MIAAEVQRPAPVFAALRAEPGGQTLEDLLLGVWEDLLTGRTAACPICAGAMTPRYGSGPAAVGGRCRDCGADLA